MDFRLLGELFLTFAKMGAVTFGGGYAMLPMLQREVVERKKWVTEEEIADYYAVGQCTPGIIAVNTATFIGQKRAGIAGGIAATLGVVFPSVVIITAVAAVLSSFAEYPAVQHAFAGIRACVCVLIANAVVKLWKKAVADRWALAIFLLVAAGSLFTSVSPMVFVVASAAAGVVIKNLEAKKA
ncbi:MAG: chromate transporter [Oscillospiraceae bacterium]|nr:chromate transporter [Oscillospiraceae bacterium]